jgi:alanyl-tRNA synthetase
VHFKLPADKLWATVYAEDDEAYDIWLKVIGLPAERIVRIGDNKGGRYMSDNFWMMGDTGPCGPCSEIFYDHGPDVAGGPPGQPEQDGDRYIEIWNNVFMQFNRTEDGVMHKLPKPSVDTGMGLERLAAVLQHVHSNYEIDLFVPAGRGQERGRSRRRGAPRILRPDSPSLKVIADHIRACAFTVADGVIPGNEGPRLRAAPHRPPRHPPRLQAGRAQALLPHPGDAAGRRDGRGLPRAAARGRRVTEVLKQEEERFFQTIANGMEILESALAGRRRQGDRRRRGLQAARHLRLPAGPDRPTCAASAA